MAKKIESGKLVAIDGSRGNDVMNAAEALATEIRDAGGTCVISRWDASGLFGEFEISSRDAQAVSARTLSLLYAADLAFRLRWEIRPALAAGQIVIAAPYLETAVKFGEACGLTDAWLHDLLRFAVGPDIRGLARERKEDKGWKGRRDRGYAEYCAGVLRQTGAKFKHKKVRASMIDLLERGRKSAWDLSKRGVEDAAKVILTGNRRASAPPKS